MPPRFVYWTIIAGGLPTAFRAAEREELLPTFKRIQDKHPAAVMKYFARGRARPGGPSRGARPRLAAGRRASRPAAEIQGRQEKAQPGLAQRAIRTATGVGGTAAGETSRRSASQPRGQTPGT
jgi:hypothetical protein